MNKKLIMPVLAVLTISTYLVMLLFNITMPIKCNFTVNVNSTIADQLMMFVAFGYLINCINYPMQENFLHICYDIFIKFFIIIFLAQFMSTLSLAFFALFLIIVTIHNIFKFNSHKNNLALT